MASKDSVKKVFAMVFFKHPNRRPATEEEFNVCFEIWREIFKELADEALMKALYRFVAETKSLYPGDDPFAIILDTAKPTLQETEGDAIELAFEAARSFGRMREAEAMAWLKEKSPLIASVVGRFGFREICTSTEPDVVRGQLRAIFKGEKERSRQVGGIVESAKHLSGGGNKQLLPLLGKIGNKCLADESKGGDK